MVSICDIAREAEVSVTTVSRVLANKSASIETRRKVLRAVEKFGYVPDARASSLKSRKTKSVGLIIPDISNPVYPVTVKVTHDIAKVRGYHLILGNTYGRLDEEMEILKMMLRERVAGLILGICEGEDDTSCNSYLNKIINSGVSVVLTGRNRNGLQVDEITTDNKKGAYKATNYLLKIGRKRIGFMAGRRGLLATDARLAGYLQAFSEKRVGQNEKLLSFGDWTRVSGQKQMRSLLNSGEKPDAVFCANDLLAIGAMETIKKAGLKIPDDIAVVGFDDIELSSLVQPRLTTVNQPQEKIAEIACNLLLDRIERNESEEPKEILLEPELIIRESA